jgi:NAD(P)-dependent dehydrogenase (short-subunit alcohol dehydrogenase family)
MTGQLDGKIALVTAGGGGIGQATAWLLAERGAQVIAADIDSAGLEETARNATPTDRLRTILADATTLAGAEAAVNAAKDAFGGLTILVNVVGGSRPGKTVVDMDLEEWDRWVRLNLTSTFLMCKAAIPVMANSGGGSIVNISSGAGVTGMKKNPAYVAAKGGVVALASANLVGRIGQPHDIAAMVAFLSSKDGEFVNGELITIGGGHKAGI